MSNIHPLEVRHLIENLIMLSDNSWSGEVSVEDSSEPSIFHPVGSINDSSKGDKWMNYGSPIARGVDVGPFPPIQSSIDMEYVEVAQNK